VMYFVSPLAGRPGSIRHATAALTLLLGLVLAGCASVPPPNDSMNLAQNRLQEARDAGAADYAPVDLGFAQDKFQQAQAAMAERKYAMAADLATESGADAELARAKARLGAVRARILDKQQENSRVRQQGDQAQAAAQQEMAAPLPATTASPAAPIQDMPAPSASVLSAPSDGGFQTVPAPTSSPASSSSTQQGQP
jgi:hypothetical protein